MPEPSKSLPTLVEELWALVVAYAKQETVGPLKSLVKYVAYGFLGSIMLGIGLVLVVLGGLRVLQVETDTTFTGNWSWAPYGIALFVLAAIIGLAVRQVTRGAGAKPTTTGTR